MTVQDLQNLKMSFINSYIVRESLNGKNQYNCENCKKYVDAEKVIEIKIILCFNSFFNDFFFFLQVLSIKTASTNTNSIAVKIYV